MLETQLLLSGIIKHTPHQHLLKLHNFDVFLLTFSIINIVSQPTDDYNTITILQNGVEINSNNYQYRPNFDYEYDLVDDDTSYVYTITLTNNNTHKSTTQTFTASPLDEQDLTPPVITVTYGGSSISDGATVNVEKYSGIEAVVSTNEGTLVQDISFNNTTSESIIYSATDANNNSASFTINYNVVDTVAPTGSLGTPVIDELNMTIKISSLSESCGARFYRGNDQLLEFTTVNNSVEHIFTIDETSYGTYNYKIQLNDGTNDSVFYTFSANLQDNRTPVITATTNEGVSLVSGDNVNIEKYSGVEPTVTTDIGTLDQSYAFNNQTNRSISYFASNNGNSTTFTINYLIVDTVPATGTLGTPVIDDLSMTIGISGITEDDVMVILYKGTNAVESQQLITSRTYTFAPIVETDYGSYDYIVTLFDGGNNTDYPFTVLFEDTVPATGTLGTPVIDDLTMSIGISGISEDNVMVILYKGTNAVDSQQLTTERTHTFASVVETDYGSYDYIVSLFDGVNNTNYSFTVLFEAPEPEPEPGVTPVDRIEPTAGSWVGVYDFLYIETNANTGRFLYRLVRDGTSERVHTGDTLDLEYDPSDGNFHDIGTSAPNKWTDNDAGTGLTSFPTDANMPIHYWYNDGNSMVMQFNNPYYVAPIAPSLVAQLHSTEGAWGARAFDTLSTSGDAIYVYAYGDSFPQHDWGYDWAIDTWVDVGEGDPKTFEISFANGERFITGYRAEDSQYGASALIFKYPDPYYVAPPSSATPTSYVSFVVFGTHPLDRGTNKTYAITDINWKINDSTSFEHPPQLENINLDVIGGGEIGSMTDNDIDWTSGIQYSYGSVEIKNRASGHYIGTSTASVTSISDISLRCYSIDHAPNSIKLYLHNIDPLTDVDALTTDSEIITTFTMTTASSDDTTAGPNVTYYYSAVD